jgi:hypothetical protein
MSKKPLRSQMNQVRAWVRQGRTDAWIAHQLDVSASELRQFRRRHGLSPNGEETAEEDLRDEIEAEIEAATRAAEEAEPEEEEEEQEGEEATDAGEAPDKGEPGRDGDGARDRPRRRRGRRRGRGRATVATVQATFDHGEEDGIGLWLDPAVKDNSIYAEHWAGHRPVDVSIEADRIMIRRASPDS